MLEQQDFLIAVTDILKQARHGKKYTLDKLAEKSNVDYSTVNLIENGKQNPRIYTVYKLLYALDIDLAHLLANKKVEMQDEKKAILNKLEKLDLETLECVCTFLEVFKITQK